jgi:hypothetical protein
MRKFDLRSKCDVQTYGLGVKEVWEVPADKIKPGCVDHHHQHHHHRHHHHHHHHHYYEREEEEVMRKFDLRSKCDVQTGVKEVWEVPADKIKPG